MAYRIVDESLIRACEDSVAERERHLFLEPHPEFMGFWKVNSFNSSYFFEFRDLIGPYRALAPARLDEFFETAEEREYEVAFFDDPTTILDAYEALNDPPPFSINSAFEGTINGLLPFQLQGFNFLKDLPSGVAQWSTGTGKTVLAAALIKYRLHQRDTDFTWFVAKAHNKVNVQRALKRLADLDSIVIQGDQKRRQARYAEVGAQGGPVIAVVNYEQFRDDHKTLLPFFDGTDSFVIWDEMPTRLSSRDSARYKHVCKTLYSSTKLASAKVRPRHLRQMMLSATPIEREPSDWGNCVRILDPSIYGTVASFEAEYVARYSWYDEYRPEVWHRLDKMGMKAAHITHQVDKEDPDIAKYFPEAIPIPTYIDWHDGDREIYDMMATNAEKHGLDEINVLAAITVLQMICDAPTLIEDSAALYEAWEDSVEVWMQEGGDGREPAKHGSMAAFELISKLKRKLSNDKHTKLAKLREILTERHPKEKVCVFSALKTGLITPGQHKLSVLAGRLEDWKIPYVVYAGTPKQKQTAQDRFMEDPKIRVFLSSDMGSDSLDLYAGSVCVDYDLPWNWSRKIQRHNRIHRATSEHATVYYYSLMMADSVEERKEEINARKEAYHKGVFKGGIADQAASARMSRADLVYVLTGNR